MCVQCIAAQPGTCVGTTPVCGDDEACHGCASDADCASRTCMADGSCAAASSVLYAAADGAATTGCTLAEKCSLARAIALIDGTKSTIRLDPGPYDLAATLTLGANMHLVGRGALINRAASGTGATLVISGGADVTLDYLAVQGGDGDMAGIGIGCTSASLTAREIRVEANAAAGIISAGCAVTLTHVGIASNHGIGVVVSGGSLAMARSDVTKNEGGGVSVTLASFDLENNLIVQNGSRGLGFGAVAITQVPLLGPHVLDFNTIAHNQAGTGFAPGVICSVIARPLVFSNNIVFGNVDVPSPTASQVEGANCGWAYSDIGPEPLAGTGNLTGDPQFVDPIHHDYHLQPTSPARNAAEPSATLAVDIDGDDRPQGPGRDVGADEIK